MQSSTISSTPPGSLFAGREIEILAAWDGSENLLWRFAVSGFEGTAVLKLYPDAGLARGRRQVDGPDRFAVAGLAPRVYWFDRAPANLPEPLIVYGWTEGKAIEPGDDNALLLMADVAAAIHSSSTEGINRYSTQPLSLASWLELQRATVNCLLPWLESHDPTLAAAISALSTRALALAAAGLPLWQDATLAPVHGDLAPENVVQVAGEAQSPILLLDWEQYGLGDPAREAARLLHLSAPADGGAAWLTRYFAAFAGAPPNLAERI
ncbi:MAG: phosphotransferase family protein, partial [Caldilineaceae bacterium]